MRFLLTAEHEMLGDSIRRLLADRSSVAEVRRRAEGDGRPDDDLWRRCCALGLTGMMAAEASGGFAASAVEAMVVVTEWGRAIQLGNVIDTNVAVAALDRADADCSAVAEYQPGLVDGSHRASWCYAAGDGSMAAPPVRATIGPDLSRRLNGTASFVVEATSSTLLLVSAAEAHGAVIVVVPSDQPGVTIGPSFGLDLTRRIGDVRFDDVEVRAPQVIASGPGAGDLLLELRDLAATLVCADALGAVAAVVEATVAYSKDRIAFGRPIGSYQAIKHACADMVVAREKCQVATWQAAIALRDRWPDRRRAVAIAKTIVGGSCSALVSEAHQIFGGIGFTWEHDLHLFLRRTRADEVLFGDQRHYLEVLAAEILGAEIL